VIWKESPSRIRRATLRMTLESSTTKHVFISIPFCFIGGACARPKAQFHHSTT
jgi:hypothetical protein